MLGLVNCEYCEDYVLYPFKCNFCNGVFCSKCRLPETHQCTHLEIVRSTRRELTVGSKTQSTRNKTLSGSSRLTSGYSPKDLFRRRSRPVYGSRGNEPWRMLGGTTVGHEALDIIIAATLIFAVLSYRNIFPGLIGRSYFAGILLTIVSGFIGHELSHRFYARQAGLNARFVLWTQGIMLTLLGFVLPFVFIVPGFVFMTGYASRSINGKVALSGPLINILNGIALFILSRAVNVVIWDLQLGSIFEMAAFFNFFLALFNLIPIGPLDGRKVREWHPLLWAISLGSALLLWLLAGGLSLFI